MIIMAQWNDEKNILTVYIKYWEIFQLNLYMCYIINKLFNRNHLIEI